MDWNVSDDAVGLILIALTALLVLIAWHLATRGLAKIKDAAETLDKNVVKLSQVQEDFASAKDADTEAVKKASEAVREAAITIESGRNDLTSALAELKGPLAPARAFLAFAAFAFIASIIAFGVVSATVDTGGDTTTTTDTQTEPTTTAP
jgi:hypothetical protein